MMNKSTIKKEQSDIFKLANYEYKDDDGAAGNLTKREKLEIEQSQTYIGYKLMWVMKMFLEGKKFP
jgi:hypothetical protein